MIARLTGLVAQLGSDTAIIDVGGVGYLVGCSTRTLGQLSEGADVRLHIDTVVREDAFLLYGFATEEEQAWFRLLQGVQGVGARVALAILSTLSAAELQSAIANGDKAMVARTPGVGPKLAQRIVTELADKTGPALGSGDTSAAGAPPPAGTLAADAASALANLGFKPAQAAKVIKAAMDELGENASVEDIVRSALKRSAR
ncbi:Holliday junction branch migration protein RuvA [Pacificimonas flava]|uniref:Holliday junction branch migration complex subunit RuvA n=2 Tax=Pacificimonas TaxID=1960290 RepID=A0A219B1U5_9SPHN|nr:MULTISPECIES: Holliday junction branch migration protein RuvA [Pacificimonas]MBZ6378023.1 Holliday junction branch migration protein RuvA [Pacificimonas aurantium]OWV32332.1 Holliday junction branch migration protein RuvA [Pacificimonas flava]